MGRATEIVECQNCSYEYSVTKHEIQNIGFPWHAVWVAICLNCGYLNVVHSEKREYFGTLNYETKYDKNFLEVVTVVKSNDLGKRSEFIHRIQNDEVYEKDVQQYVKENPGMFGLQHLEGPFSTGPDFKGVWNGEEVEIEVERTYTNYKSHQHHMSWAFRNVSILICLDDKEPTLRSREGLPPNIWYINQQHFLEWYLDFLVRESHSKMVAEAFGMLVKWFQDRLMEEEVGFHDYHTIPTFGECGQNIELASKEMAFEFLDSISVRFKEEDLVLNEIDAMELLHFYFSQKDKYLKQ